MRPNDDSRQGCMRRLAHVATISATIVLLAAEAMALSVTLGDQDFANDTVVTSEAEFNAASLGEPAPFNGLLGDDSWAHHFRLAGLSATPRGL